VTTIPQRTTPQDWYDLLAPNARRIEGPFAITTAELDALDDRPRTPDMQLQVWGINVTEIPDWPEWMP
jgi:hypothetical protein